MESILLNLIPRLESLGLLSYWIIFLVGILESLPFVGVFIPGGLILIGFGFLASQGTFHLGDLIWASFFGSVIADSIGYYLGRYKRGLLFTDKSWFFNPRYLEKADKYFKSHGGKSVFFGRFIGFLRPFVAVVAGMHHMKYGKFLFYNVTSGFLWSTLYILIGFFFAEQAKAIVGWINNTGYLIVGVVVIGGVALYMWKRYAYKKLMEEKTAEITNKL